MHKPGDIKVSGWDWGEPPGSQPNDDPAKMTQASDPEVLGPIVLHHDHSAQCTDHSLDGFSRLPPNQSMLAQQGGPKEGSCSFFWSPWVSSKREDECLRNGNWGSHQGSASGHAESYVCTHGSQIMLSIVGRAHCTEQKKTQCGLLHSEKIPFSDWGNELAFWVLMYTHRLNEISCQPPLMQWNSKMPPKIIRPHGIYTSSSQSTPNIGVILKMQSRSLISWVLNRKILGWGWPNHMNPLKTENFLLLVAEEKVRDLKCGKNSIHIFLLGDGGATWQEIWVVSEAESHLPETARQ